MKKVYYSLEHKGEKPIELRRNVVGHDGKNTVTILNDETNVGFQALAALHRKLQDFVRLEPDAQQPDETA